MNHYFINDNFKTAKILVRESGAGFTILELLVAVSIFSGLMIMAALLFTNVFTGSNQQVFALSNVDQARLVTSQFTNEMRNATTGVEGSAPLNTASDNQIIFFSRAASPGATVNRIRYYLNGINLYKGVTLPSGNPPNYNLAQESNIIVQRDMTNGVTPIFTYYDGNYAGAGNALAQPVNINSIKFVKINLIVLTRVKENINTTFSINAGATVRNLKNNLGN